MRKILLINCSLLLIFLIGCKPKEEPLSYDSFNHIEHWDDIKKIEMGLVIIYYYSPYCLVCQAIEEDVFKYAHAASKNYIIYFIHSGMILDQGQPNFEIPSTPALIILQDSELKQYERGPIAVVEYLKNLAND